MCHCIESIVCLSLTLSFSEHDIEMEGSKLHSVQLQLSLIENEKERLLFCLQNAIERVS